MVKETVQKFHLGFTQCSLETGIVPENTPVRFHRTVRVTVTVLALWRVFLSPPNDRPSGMSPEVSKKRELLHISKNVFLAFTISYQCLCFALMRLHGRSCLWCLLGTQGEQSRSPRPQPHSPNSEHPNSQHAQSLGPRAHGPGLAMELPSLGPGLRWTLDRWGAFLPHREKHLEKWGLWKGTVGALHAPWWFGDPGAPPQLGDQGSSALSDSDRLTWRRWTGLRVRKRRSHACEMQASDPFLHRCWKGTWSVSST